MRRFAPLAILAATLLHGSLTQVAKPLATGARHDTNCGCCENWVKHLEVNGSKVTDHVEADMSTIKSRLGVPYSVDSCHIGVVDDKFAKGYIPATDILKLRKRADLAGIAIPGMPVGSPDMEMGDRQDAYQVVGLTRNSQTSVLAEYPGH